MHEVADSKQLNGAAQRLRSAGLVRSFEAIGHVLPHVQVLKKAGFLKHVAQVALPGRPEYPTGVVLPKLLTHKYQPLGRLFQARHAAQQAGLARARRSKQDGDTPSGQVKIGLEREVWAYQIQAQSQALFVAHGSTRTARWRSIDRPNKTANENTSMPPASQCACAYTMASTWP